jgi:tetratricopeptide (TPR) repeat protein
LIWQIFCTLHHCTKENDQLSGGAALHAGYKANLANLNYWNGDAQAAARKALEALELQPQHRFALMALIQAYTLAGNYSGVQQLLENLPPALLQWPSIRVRTGLYYLAKGDVQRAREIYSEYMDNPPLLGVLIYVKLALGLGEVETAINVMESEVERNSWTQLWARSLFRQNDAVKDRPHYLALLKRIGLDDESVAVLQRKMSFD